MKIKIPACFALLPAMFLGVPVSFGMDWPSQSGDLIQNFGWNNQGRPILGISFAAGGAIRAAEAGELIFAHSENNTASRLPSPLGAWVALDHGDELISVYSRFQDKPESEFPNIIEKDAIIASAGQSGWTDQDGFYFSFFDRRERRWVNPSMFISPMEDSRQPVIQWVQLKNTEGRIFNPGQVRSLAQGRYTISAYVTDTRINAGENPLAPHRIVCSVNGVEVGTLAFETYSARDGILTLYRNGLVPTKQVYAQVPGFEIGDVWFTRGQATLEIIAQDISGNARNLTYRLQIE
ncbi:MAG: M23 family metallopeptidase [Spirochaetaceae bacterium]|jgi:hypothetical protein|nr:M23 family metallopeptidase [Spirochaetaceae bacterium]